MKRSYASLFHPSSALSIASKPIQKYKGSRIIAFSDEEITKLAEPYRFSLVDTFWYERPPIATISNTIDRISFTSTVRTGS